MFGIFMESWVIFKQYCGTGFLPVVFLAALLYLLVTEKERYKRIVLVYVPGLVFISFFIPITRIVFVAAMDEGATYYRFLWLIPMGLIIAYAGCRVIYQHRRIGLVVITAVVVLCGSCVYRSSLITKAENPYHIPQTVIDICDLIAPKDGEPRIRAAFPSELVYFVRQYDTDIMLPFGREMVETQWDYYNAVYDVMEKPETIDTKALIEATRETKCSYVILAVGRKMTQDPATCGLTLIATIGKYNIYADPEIINS